MKPSLVGFETIATAGFWLIGGHSTGGQYGVVEDTVEVVEVVDDDDGVTDTSVAVSCRTWLFTRILE